MRAPIHPLSDAWTAEHFKQWLARHVHDEDQEQVTRGILLLLAEQPELIDTHSWPEMRSLAEGAGR